LNHYFSPGALLLGGLRKPDIKESKTLPLTDGIEL